MCLPKSIQEPRTGSHVGTYIMAEIGTFHNNVVKGSSTYYIIWGGILCYDIAITMMTSIMEQFLKKADLPQKSITWAITDYFFAGLIDRNAHNACG